MKLYVARHGQTDWNALNKVCGATDRPLNEKGFEQAKALGERVKGLNIDIIVASPLVRAQQTAAEVAKVIGAPIVTDSRLTEQNYGIYEGVDRGDERFLANKRQFCVDYPNGESMFRVAHRVYNAIENAKAKYADKNVLFVCHGGVCRVIRTYFEAMTNEEYFGYSPDNAFLAEYEL